MNGCGCHQTATTANERKILQVAFGLNASMFVIGLIAGWLANSISLVADSLDMLADASIYAMALYVIGRSIQLKNLAAILSGSLLLFLGIGVLVEAVRHTFLNDLPKGTVMMLVASISLLVNVNVLRLLSKFRKSEIHLRAAWIFTRADVLVNLGVIISGTLVLVIHSNYPDIIAGFLIGLYVLKEAIEILKDVRKTNQQNTQTVLS